MLYRSGYPFVIFCNKTLVSFGHCDTRFPKTTTTPQHHNTTNQLRSKLPEWPTRCEGKVGETVRRPWNYRSFSVAFNVRRTFVSSGPSLCLLTTGSIRKFEGHSKTSSDGSLFSALAAALSVAKSTRRCVLCARKCSTSVGGRTRLRRAVKG